MNLPDWESAYRSGRKIWGRRPSEAALAAAKFVSDAGFPTAGKRMLELGCGYGRDAFFLATQWDVRMTAVDSSQAAVAMAKTEARPDMEFRVAHFQDVTDGPYDLIYAANLYQILPPEERRQFVRAVETLLAPSGLFVLGTLSTRDPEHAGKGTAVPGEANSWMDKKYIHLSDRKELEEGFRFLRFHRFFEHEFLEPRKGGVNHHHISWILIALRDGEGGGRA
jgi:cyclopropane fatty-acyl-phospholipid synthase-like methyltransferase